MVILLIVTAIAGLLITLYHKQLPLESILIEEEQSNTSMHKKGQDGEEEIANILRHLPGKFLLYNNLYIPTGFEKWTEIDLVVVHEKGVFVIESKNYSGSISGEMRDQFWLKSMSSTYAQRFYNPIKQNEGHIRALKKVIGELPIYSIIVFGQEAELHVEQLPANDVYVCKVSQLRFLWDLLATLEKEVDLESVRCDLEQLDETTWAIQQQHIDNIQKKYGNRAVS